MRKYTITSILGIIGIISWTMTIFLREQSIKNECLNFILGIMPNISATWFFIAAGEYIISSKNINFNFNKAKSTSLMVLLFAVASEIIHHLILNSTFDIYDNIATIISIIIYLIIFYYNKSKFKKVHNII